MVWFYLILKIADSTKKNSFLQKIYEFAILNITISLHPSVLCQFEDRIKLEIKINGLDAAQERMNESVSVNITKPSDISWEKENIFFMLHSVITDFFFDSIYNTAKLSL